MGCNESWMLRGIWCNQGVLLFYNAAFYDATVQKLTENKEEEKGSDLNKDASNQVRCIVPLLKRSNKALSCLGEEVKT